MGVLVGTCGVLTGCMTNNVVLEFLVKADPGCGNLVTFAQFLFISLVSFVVNLNTKRQIPIRNYLFVVVLFFMSNISNHLVFNYKISMPLVIIFRSGTLLTSMIMTIIILKRNYTLSKYLSVGMVTLGVIICAIASGKEMKDAVKTEEQDDFFRWLLGISLLVFGLVVAALLGVFQELLVQQYGKHPKESVFYTHLLSLPVFLVFSNNILEHLKIAIHSQPLTVPELNIEIPSILNDLLWVAVSQYLCVYSVYYLQTEATSLTVTLVVTIRKFLSLLLSIVYFQNSFTFNHWLGTLFVFIGTIIYTKNPFENSKVEKSQENAKV